MHVVYYYRFLLLLIFFCSWLKPNKDVVALIERYRVEQSYGSSSQHDWYEAEIAKLKKEHGMESSTHIPSSYKEVLHNYLRLIPFFIWQLLVLLLSLLLFIVQRPWRLVPILMVLICFVWVEYDIRHQTIKVIPVDSLSLHIGPKSSYPVQKKLSYLDEITLKGHEVLGWKYVQYQDLKGWIAYDASFNW